VEKVLSQVNLEVGSREILGVVGETGCGKSVTALSILRLLPKVGQITEGEIWFEGRDLLKLSEEQLRTEIRGNRISMIFQEPTTSLNPVYTIGDQIAEVFRIHKHMNGGEAMKQTIEILWLIKMPEPSKIAYKYPHELSGGMRQRAMIAMGLACRPKLLIADEPTSNLDVAIQAQCLEVFKGLKKMGTAVLIITHNFGIVAEICDKVVVMYAGTGVESGDVDSLFEKPMHPYTIGLLAAIPMLRGVKKKRLNTVEGSVPSFVDPPLGCRFHPRCPNAMEICKKEKPGQSEIDKSHHVACHLFR
jgi:oligopeptide/dipeptide ABC transporter ATP-binding protein